MRSNGAKATLANEVILIQFFFGLVSHACQRKSMGEKREIRIKLRTKGHAHRRARKQKEYLMDVKRNLEAARGRETRLIQFSLTLDINRNPVELPSPFPQLHFFLNVITFRNKTENQNEAKYQTFQSLFYAKCKRMLYINSTCTNKWLWVRVFTLLYVFVYAAQFVQQKCKYRTKYTCRTTNLVAKRKRLQNYNFFSKMYGFGLTQI